MNHLLDNLFREYRIYIYYKKMYKNNRKYKKKSYY